MLITPCLQNPLKKSLLFLHQVVSWPFTGHVSLCRYEPAPLFPLCPRLPAHFPPPPGSFGGEEVQTCRVPLEADAGEWTGGSPAALSGTDGLCRPRTACCWAVDAYGSMVSVSVGHRMANQILSTPVHRRPTLFLRICILHI